MKTIFFKLGLAFFFSCARLAAQQFHVESLTISDGLSQGMIFDIEQTEDGFLWFATMDGLNRYDGYNFKVYTNDPFNPFSISGNCISSMFEDSRGNLWLSTLGVGFDMLEKRSGRFLHLSALDGLHPFNHFSMTETPDGTLWAGTADGLFRIRWKNPGHIDTDNPDLSASVWVEQVSRGARPGKQYFDRLSANTDGTLTVYINEDGIYKFTPATGSLHPLLPVSNWQMFLGANPGRVWATHNNRVYVLENGGKPRKTWLDQYMHLGQEGEVICTDHKGNLYFTAREGKRFCVYSVPEKALYGEKVADPPRLIGQLEEGWPTFLKTDRSGNLWVGSSGYGLRKINLYRPSFQHFLAGKSIGPIKLDPKIHVPGYYQNEDSNSFIFDEASNSLQPDPDFPKNMVVFNVFQAKNGTVYYWAHPPGTFMPQYLYIRNAGKTERLAIALGGDQLSPFFEDMQGNLWTGDRTGHLMYIQPSTKSIAHFDCSKELGDNARVSAFYEDAEHKLWVGTTNGLLKMDIGELDVEKLNGQMFSQLPKMVYQTDRNNTHSLRNNVVTSLCPDPSNPGATSGSAPKGVG